MILPPFRFALLWVVEIGLIESCLQQLRGGLPHLIKQSNSLYASSSILCIICFFCCFSSWTRCWRFWITALFFLLVIHISLTSTLLQFRRISPHLRLLMESLRFVSSVIRWPSALHVDSKLTCVVNSHWSFVLANSSSTLCFSFWIALPSSFNESSFFNKNDTSIW